MFTGIVEELGTVELREGKDLRIAAKTVLQDATLGDSIAVNGCCLTLVDQGEGWWQAEVTDETYDRTNLGDLVVGDRVNLERPVRLVDRLGGHMVLGHVDATGEILRAAPDLAIKMPRDLSRYVVAKGSITIDGVSLTVVDLYNDGLTVAVIPHTSEVTTIGYKGPGDRVNLEVDVMAKHIERLLAGENAELADIETAMQGENA